MHRIRAIALGILVAVAVTPARSEVPMPAALQVLGTVRSAARPVAHALVVALNLADFDTIQTYTAGDGSFTLPPLRAGIYKIIALKHGFAPAIKTVLPTRPSQRLTLALQNEAQKQKNVNNELWEIRGSLPPDILRELDAVLTPPVAVVSNQGRRIRGEMMSVTGVADQSPAFAQTALGVQSRIGENWELGFRGNLHRIEDPTDDATFGSPLAESSVMAMELRSSRTDAYRVESTKSWWRYRTDGADSRAQADLRSHNFEWEHGTARVQVRYFAQQNLFTSLPSGSDLIEIAGGTTVLQTSRSDVGISLRVMQESLHNNANEPLRTADLTANGSLEIVPSLVVHYGMSSRVGVDGTSWAPRSGAEWKIGRDTALVASGMYKVIDPVHATVALPMLVAVADDSRVLPHYAYRFGIVAGDESSRRLSAIATVTAIDAPLRVIFDEGFEQFWDGLYIDAGDLRRDLRLSYRKQIGGKLAIDVATSAGTATPAGAISGASKAYVTGDVQSVFLPTGTTLAISYRGIRQPQPSPHGDYRSERVNVRMAQPLHLPLDLRVLLGLEVAHAENSPFLLDTLEPSSASRKYIGGLAVNF